MKKAFGALFAVLVFCCSPVLGPAQAQAECTTQGALALGLAEVLKLNVTTVTAAVTALTTIGVEPDGGWKPEECLTPEVTAQIQAAYAAAVAGGRSGILAPGAIDAALDALRPVDRERDISPSRP